MMTSSDSPQFLPIDFQPTINEVIVGRGKKPYNHVGNARFREIVKEHAEEYSAAANKTLKSAVIAKVLKRIRSNSAYGGFVKLNDGVWECVCDSAARITVAQNFRDALHSNYKSSKQFKQMKRKTSKDLDNSSHSASSSNSSSKTRRRRTHRGYLNGGGAAFHSTGSSMPSNLEAPTSNPVSMRNSCPSFPAYPPPILESSPTMANYQYDDDSFNAKEDPFEPIPLHEKTELDVKALEAVLSLEDSLSNLSLWTLSSDIRSAMSA